MISCNFSSFSRSDCGNNTCAKSENACDKLSQKSTRIDAITSPYLRTAEKNKFKVYIFLLLLKIAFLSWNDFFFLENKRNTWLALRNVHIQNMKSLNPKISVWTAKTVLTLIHIRIEMINGNFTSRSCGIYLFIYLLFFFLSYFLNFLSPCGGEHSYYCGDDYCAIHKTACNLFISNDFNLLNAPFQKCQNGNKIKNRILVKKS